MVIAAAEQGGACRGTQGGRVEAIVFEPAGREALRGGHLNWTAEGARSAKTNVVEKNDQHVGRADGWSQRNERREPRAGVLGVPCDRACVDLIRNRQNRARNTIGLSWQTNLQTRTGKKLAPSVINSMLSGCSRRHTSTRHADVEQLR